ncbi:hypothetical protein BA895_18625 [Humibacillus sp. DSM 29435]|uniref:hypothetical protein n=1 Tax=Humibacillus sp. DSM 29435 TaxID=1869167 RepID=UPI000871C202|nr:hypothetical protein [Humibacillus sp. DSM 29435]OFE16981.1 hypothetical protein BA895_18625 [Humibacillus sp. DSM 29435]
MILHLRAAVEQLYAAPLARFTPLRTELVVQSRAAGDKALAASVSRLRKPTVAAWAVNQYVRGDGDGVADLREFAQLLRTAQRTLDADQLRVLGRERAGRVDALADAIAGAARTSGQALGATVQQEVRDTLTALIADEQAEASVMTGSLVRALSYSGFGSVDIDDVVAVNDLPEAGGVDETSPTDGRPDLEVLQGGGAAVDLADRRVARRAERRSRLTGTLDTARASLRAADRQVAVLTARHEEVTEGIADLERRLATARSRLEKVAGELAEATGIRDAAERAEGEAQRSLDSHDESS